MDIMEQCDNLVVKLLLSCHGRSTFVQKLVSHDEILLVPPSIDGDGQGWSNRTWERTVATEIEELGSEMLDVKSEEEAG